MPEDNAQDASVGSVARVCTIAMHAQWLEVPLHHAKLRTDTNEHAEGLRQSQKGRAKRRAVIAAHRAKKQRAAKI